MKAVSYGRWYYDRASTGMPTLTLEDGTRSDWGAIERALERGESVTIRPASMGEHAKMIVEFEQQVRKLAKQGWVYGLGNFEPGADEPSAQTINDRITALIFEARQRLRPA
jgi:hypothetical protein